TADGIEFAHYQNPNSNHVRLSDLLDGEQALQRAPQGLNRAQADSTSSVVRGRYLVVHQAIVVDRRVLGSMDLVLDLTMKSAR
ncbi:MAG: hypothetical protein JNL62_28670, partial [Bryobacterales bacterium]|nr:hypothetical protein [Bryobacterales bacterium]